MKTINFLAESNRIEKLEKLKDSLVRLNESVEWEGFRQPIEKAIRKDQEVVEDVRPMMLC